MLYKFFRNATFNIIADFSNRLSNAIIVILISKFLTLSDFGSYNIATTYLTFGMLFSFWGYGNLLTREVAKEPTKFEKYFLNFGIMRFFFSIISFLLIIVIASLLNYSYETFSIIVIISFGILAESIKNLAYSAFNAFEETYYVSIVYLISSLLKLILGYLILKNNYGINELAWLNTAINYVGAICLLFFVFKFLPTIKVKFDWDFCIEQTQIAIPLFLIAVLSIAESRLDVIILSGFFPEEIVGLYTAALVLQSGLLIFPDGIRNAIFPVLSRNSLDDSIKAGKVYVILFKFLTLISLAIATGSIFLASKLIILVYDKSYIDSVLLFQILMFSYPFYSIVILNIRFLNAYNKDNFIVKFFGIDMIITIIFSFIILPIFGGLGAAVLKVFTTGLLYFLFLKEVYKLLPNIHIRKIILQGLFASVCMGAGLYFLKDSNLFINLLIGFFIFTSTLFVVKAIGKDEFKIIKSIINQRKKNFT